MRSKKRQTLSGRAMRKLAWGVVVAGAAAPIFRKRLRLRPSSVLAASAASPLALSVAMPRSKPRDAAIYGLQMWAYFFAYSLPGDNPEKLMRRVYIDYPIKADKLIGLGQLPTTRLQRLADPNRLRPVDYILTWSHWLWYLVPHGSIVYILMRKNHHFPRAAAMVAATFDIGAVIYWAVPTAPPWWAAKLGRIPPVRRVLAEVGESFWGRAWDRMYDSLEGNPVAAMPSLHFGISIMAARMLAETGPVAGTVGWSYALVLGYALVHLGEHYVIDLVVGYGLVEAIRKLEPQTRPLVSQITDSLQALEAQART